MPKEKGVQLPADITSLSDVQLAQLETDATAEFDALADGEAPDLARATELADIIDAARGDKSRRETEAAEQAAQLQSLKDRVKPPQATEPEGEPPAEPTPTDPTPAPEPAAPALVPAPATTSPAATGQHSSTATLLAGGPQPIAPRKLNPSLIDMKRNAPRAVAPRKRSESVLVASADIPNIQQGSRLPDMDALVAAIHHRARTVPVSRMGINAPQYPVASLKLDHRFNLDMSATAEDINDVLTAATDPDALVAAGGWCAPSEISYDFYNIVCEDGMLDLPTVGINRGGMRWPTSPTFADFMAEDDNFWSWNETQDIAAATGTDQSGTKVCARVPCPDYTEERLHCDGFCLTAGNLMTDAFPELIANHTRLLFAGHAHRMNQLRILELLDSANTNVTGTLGAAGSGVVAPVLGAVELQAIDYREKFAMCEDAVLEVVLPRWLRGAMRSDLRKRTGVGLEAMEVTDARLMNWFDLINVRVQWVTDWQVRSTGYPGDSVIATAWPTTVEFMMWAAGTFVLGRGLQLNLGVIRDSVLNATNDYTAEWMEECWLIGKIGHEGRRVVVNICPDGTTGANDLTACGV